MIDSAEIEDPGDRTEVRRERDKKERDKLRLKSRQTDDD